MLVTRLDALVVIHHQTERLDAFGLELVNALCLAGRREYSEAALVKCPCQMVPYAAARGS